MKKKTKNQYMVFDKENSYDNWFGPYSGETPEQALKAYFEDELYMVKDADKEGDYKVFQIKDIITISVSLPEKPVDLVFKRK